MPVPVQFGLGLFLIPELQSSSSILVDEHYSRSQNRCVSFLSSESRGGGTLSLHEDWLLHRELESLDGCARIPLFGPHFKVVRAV